MLSSQKVFYLFIMSMLIICNVLGISVKGSNTYIVASDLPAQGLVDYSEFGDISVATDDAAFFDTNISDINVDIYSDKTSDSTTESHAAPQNDFTYQEGAQTQESDAPTPDEPVDTDVPVIPDEPDVPDIPDEPYTPTESTAAPQTETEPTTERSQYTETARTTQSTTTTTTKHTELVTTTTSYATLAPAGGNTGGNSGGNSNNGNNAARTTTTTTTTTTRRTTAATNYTNSGSISFSLTNGGSSITECRMYTGSSVKLYLNVAFGETPIASYSSDNSSIVGVYSSSVGEVTVTGYSLGSTWIHAYNSSGAECHCYVTVTDYEGQVIYLCNQYRKQQGIPELELGPASLKKVSNLRLSEIYSKFEHDRPNGQKFSTAFPACGINYGKFGENLARGYTTPEEVVVGWMNSETHRANIMNPQFKYCRISLGTKNSQGQQYMYWAQEFYTPYN